MMNILVTGAAGFIGSVVTELLVESAHNVIGIDNFQLGKKTAVNKGIIFYEGNYGDPKLLEQIFSKVKIDIIFHFAAETIIDFCMVDPSKYFQNNVVNGIVLLDCMRKFNCDKIIFSSTAATYGEPVYTPIDENHIQKPINSYGASKLMFEEILNWYNYAYDIKYNLFRYFNASGATHNNGEDRPRETHLIPQLLDAILGNREIVQIFGNDYPTNDGTCIRDYLHVEDIAMGHLLAMKNVEKNTNGKYNLGSGSGYSVLEVISMVQKVTGKKLQYEITARRAGDPAVLVASNFLAVNELGWNPSKSSLINIIEDSYRWKLKRIIK